MSQKCILLTFKGICMNFSLELKKIILSHPVTSKQPHKIVQILMRHPVCYRPFRIFKNIFPNHVFQTNSRAKPEIYCYDRVEQRSFTKIFAEKPQFWLFLHTLFLWDINEQKNCQSFQCGFSYLDSLPNALTKRIFKFYRSVQDLPAKQHSQSSPFPPNLG